MTPKVVSVSADDALADASKTLTQHRISSVLVTGRDGIPMSVLSMTDLLQIGHIYSLTQGKQSPLDLPSMCVGDLAKHAPIVISPTATIHDAAKLMLGKRLQRLFVIDGNKPVGVLSSRDLMRAVIETKEAAPIEKFMLPDAPVIQADESIKNAINLVVAHRTTGVVVMDNKTFAGIITQTEAVASKDLPSETQVGDCVGYSVITLPGATPLFRAASFAIATRARRIVVIDHDVVKGVLTGLDIIKTIA